MDDISGGSGGIRAADGADRSGPVLAVLQPPRLQRGIGLVFILLIGGFLSWSAVAGTGGAGARPLLMLPAAVAFWFGWRLARATAVGLELTPEVLRDTSGRILTRLDAIRSVDRGAFAFKPSGGFVLRLTEAPGAAWQPGLWWRFGTRLGVGGVVSRPAARHMADAIVLVLVERAAGGGD